MNPTDLMGWSCDPICWGTLLGGAWPSCHMRTALSAPTENTVLPSGDRQQSRTGALPSWLTECFCCGGKRPLGSLCIRRAKIET